MEDKELVYSPVPRSDYTVEFEGEVCGIGTHIGFNNNPGAWNLTWLSTNIMDVFLEHSKDTGELPFSSEILPLAIGTAYQHLSDGVLVGDLTRALPPKEWWEKVSNDPAFESLILYRLYGDSWKVMVEDRIALHTRNNSAKVIQLKFG